MRLPLFASLGLFPVVCAAASACGSRPQATGATGGAGGGLSQVSSTRASSSTVVSAATSTSAGGLDAGADVDNGAPSTTYPAPHPAAPQVIDLTGPVLASPKLVPVFFAGEDPSVQATLTAFVSSVGGTAYFAATTSEYGVSPAVSLAPVVLTETAPSTIDDAAIQTWLAGKLTSMDPLWPAPDGDTLYLLHYPAGTTITQQTMGGTAASCSSFGGYHDNITLTTNEQNVAYAVIPRCSHFDGLKGLDGTTGAESHEIIEACTDPYPQSEPAYAQVDDAHLYWELALGGGEVGDMCAQFPNVFTMFADYPAYEVQRTWSNAAALASHDPCVPELPGEVYFNAAPVLEDSIEYGGLATMKGVKIPIGQTKTIDVDLFSDGDTGGPWDVEVVDYNQLVGMQPTLSLGLDRNSGQNGEILHLSITPVATGQFGGSVFVLMSSQNQYTNWWLGLVGN